MHPLCIFKITEALDEPFQDYTTYKQYISISDNSILLSALLLDTFNISSTTLHWFLGIVIFSIYWMFCCWSGSVVHVTRSFHLFGCGKGCKCREIIQSIPQLCICDIKRCSKFAEIFLFCASCIQRLTFWFFSCIVRETSLLTGMLFVDLLVL